MKNPYDAPMFEVCKTWKNVITNSDLQNESNEDFSFDFNDLIGNH